MNLNTNLLALAISATFLTACGGSSSSSSNADTAPDLSPEVPLLDYSLTDNDIQKLGKTFVVGVDTKSAQLAGGLGNFGGNVLNAILEKDENGVPAGIKDGVYFALSSMEGLIVSIINIRKTGNEGITDEEIALLNADFSGNSGTFVLSREGIDGLKLIVSGTQDMPSESDIEPNREVSFEYTLIFSKTSTSSNVVVSGSLEEVSTGLNVTFTDLSFESQYEEVLPKATMSFGEISVELDGVTATAGLNANLVGAPSSAETATLNTLTDDFLDGLPLSNLIVALTGIEPSGREVLLNLEVLEVTDLRIDTVSGAGEYITAESILFEDADAAKYTGTSKSFNAVSYEFNAAGDQLVLSNDFGKTTYTYTPAPEGESDSNVMPLFMNIPMAQLSCISVDDALFGAPKLGLSCSEGGEDVHAASLVDVVGGKYIYIPGANTGIKFPTVPDLSGDLAVEFYPSIDSLAEPIRFSISANGEFGLAGGEVVPYQLSLNHPGAFDYQLEAVIGEEATALKAQLNVMENEFLLSSSIPFIPEDSVFSPTTANVELVLNSSMMGPVIGPMIGPMMELENEIAEPIIVGKLTVDGVTVAELKAPQNLNWEISRDMLPIYLEFNDGSYPESGGLFTTVEDMLVVDCPVAEEIDVAFSREEVCFADQAGVIDIESLFDTFFEGLSVSVPSPEENALKTLN